MIELEDARMVYGANVALDRITLTVAPGECLAVIGESGSGKSTLARVMLGQERLTSGTFRRDGRTRTAYVAQDPSDSLNPRMSVGRIVAEPLGGRGAAGEPVRAALKAVGLDDAVLTRRPAALSGGQQQRVSIARALVARPDLLVLDEPTSALDPSVQAQVLQLLQDLRAQRGLTSLLVTHDLPAAAYLADRIAVLHRGRLVEIGPSPAIWNDARHPYTRALLAAAVGDPLPEPDPGEQACSLGPYCTATSAPCPAIETAPALAEAGAGHLVMPSCTESRGVS
ncbi:ABC transporter ATP-binding protein [Kineosporia succinea]|uniref:Peptide/nickel transport system ATP-binding protein n=1 Tax=Kineosporia succinea TaxID=84632 RepID=A0ABT9PCC4_9ACTN|nr:ABC transporter ATP-binding protein [Kineosporia succinea]MDP9830367.1 peptide/nickel transport system ATP-binding protein [Kineosporia succinea]